MAKAPKKKEPQEGFNWEEAKEEAQASSNPNTIKEVRKLGKQLIDGEKQIEDVEAVLTELRGTQNHLKTVILPDKMAEAGMLDFTLDDGFKVEVGQYVSGSLPKEEELKERAIDHLVKLKADGLIKTTVTITFGRKEFKLAQKLFSQLVKMDYSPAMQTGVHPQTLMAWAREAIEDGVKLNLSTLGLTAGRIAKVIDPAKPKRKRTTLDKEEM